jgi:hypothetical protein
MNMNKTLKYRIKMKNILKLRAVLFSFIEINTENVLNQLSNNDQISCIEMQTYAMISDKD